MMSVGKIVSALTLACVTAFSTETGEACSVVIVGRKASSTGRVIVGHNEDNGGWINVRYAKVLARDWPAGTTMPAEPGLAAVPQVPHTLGYFWSELRRPDGPVVNADSFFNEKGVLVVTDNAGATSVDGADKDLLTDGGIRYNLRRAVAERAVSARDAVRIIGELVEKWGYEPAGRIYTVADANEGWQVQVVHGRTWVARRCPDDAIVFCPNHLTIHAVPAQPDASWIFSADAAGLSDFAGTFQAKDVVRIPHNTLRHEAGVSALLGRPWKDESYPFCVKAERVVSPEDVESVLSLKPILRPETDESLVCVFAGSVAETELRVAGQLPHRNGYRKLRPFAEGALPADVETARAAERMERHLQSDLASFTDGFKTPGDLLDATNLLAELVRFPSESRRIPEVNRIVRFTEWLLRREGFHAVVETMADGREVLYAANAETKTPDVLISAHLDVVPAIEQTQYLPRVKDGILYGRGSSDCKEHCVLAMRLMRELRGKVSVGCLFGSDEEMGGASTAFMIDRGYGARKLAFVLDSDQYVITTWQKGIGGYIVRKTLPAGHSAHQKGPPPNAVIDLAQRFTELQKRLAAESDAAWGDSATCFQLNGKAHRAEMDVRIKVAKKDDWERIERILKDEMGDVTIECTRRGEAVILDENADYLLEFRERMRKLWPDRNVGFYHLNSSTDARHVQRLGVPMIITGIDASGAHSANERCILSSFAENEGLIRDYVIDLSEREKWSTEK